MKELIEIQSKLIVPKNQHNNHGNFNYRSAEDILSAAKPLLKELDCAITIFDDIVQIGTRFYIKSTASLSDGKDGRIIASASGFAREPQTQKGMNEAQITGSSSSYAKKYALCNLFALDDEKDPDDPKSNPDNHKTPSAAPKANPPKNNSGQSNTPPKYKPTASQETLITNLFSGNIFSVDEKKKYRTEFKNIKNGKEMYNFIAKIKKINDDRKETKK